jgi:hypothetical protein
MAAMVLGADMILICWRFVDGRLDRIHPYLMRKRDTLAGCGDARAAHARDVVSGSEEAELQG